jgi:hypothetical protein
MSASKSSTAKLIIASLRRRLRDSEAIEYVRLFRWHWYAMAQRRAKRSHQEQYEKNQLPIVFGNAIAKGGSHLLAQYLTGLSKVTPLVMTSYQPIRLLAPEGRERKDERVVKDLARLRHGDMAWGYVPARVPFIDLLTRADWITYFIYRDPRDKIISHILYALEIHEGHAMREFYRAKPDMEAMIDATIRGVPGLVPSIREAYASYRGWLEKPSVLKVRYEDLILERNTTLRWMVQPFSDGNWFVSDLEYLEILETINQAMAPEHSLTYRKGQAGAWKDYFTEKNITTFKDLTGDLLLDLGYESSMDW